MSSSESPNKPGSYTVGLSTARFLDQAMLDDVAPVVPASPASRPSTAPAPAARPTTPSASPANSSPSRVESDQDVNSYMQQLLQRSNKLAPETPVPAAAAPQPSVNPKSSGDTEPQSDLPATPEQELEDSWTTEQYMPKKTAPEREADLRAFRQLANASARGALNSFQQNVHRKQSRVSGIVAICSLVVAAPLYLMSGQWGDNWSLCFFGAIALAGSSAWHFHKSGQSARSKR